MRSTTPRDDYAAVRATLTRRLIDEPTAACGRLASRLSPYWYYRARLGEARRWLLLGHDAFCHGGGNGGDPVDGLVARLSLAAILAHQRRIDLTRALTVDVDAQVHDTVPDRLGEVGRTLTFLAMSCYTVEAWDLLVDLHRLLQWVTDTDDANLALLSDAVGCCALLASGCADELTRPPGGAPWVGPTGN